MAKHLEMRPLILLLFLKIVLASSNEEGNVISTKLNTCPMSFENSIISQSKKIHL